MKKPSAQLLLLPKVDPTQTTPKVVAKPVIVLAKIWMRRWESEQQRRKQTEKRKQLTIFVVALEVVRLLRQESTRQRPAHSKRTSRV